MNFKINKIKFVGKTNKIKVKKKEREIERDVLSHICNIRTSDDIFAGIYPLHRYLYIISPNLSAHIFGVLMPVNAGRDFEGKNKIENGKKRGNRVGGATIVSSLFLMKRL